MDRFEIEIKKGLSKKHKALPSKYFYDDRGSELFQEIMNLEEYYLPRCEREIIKESSGLIASKISEHCEALDLIELGAGDGVKTVELIKAFHPFFKQINYYPLDISAQILEENKKNIQGSVADLSVHPLDGNYFETLPTLQSNGKKRLILFLGSNIGNYNRKNAINFINFLKENCRSSDLLLIAFDLKKDPNKILSAYNDEKGITAQFNLNLLERINKELNANFNLNEFKHFPTYDPVSGDCKSYLISQKQQTVIIDERAYHFKAFEAIKTEVSKKYDFSEIENFAKETGIKMISNYSDSNKYYSLVLFQI